MISGFTGTTDIMEEFFKDILAIQGVKGIMLFSLDGDLVYRHFLDPWRFEPEKKDWWGFFVYSLDGIKEAEMVYERERLYIRRAQEGYLVVLTNNAAPMAMIRLQCGILLSGDHDGSQQKGLSRFFRAKKKG
jgi:predicted regulator of Ras-like GTPase activity (Roadblock/LC7/MglB family)